MCRRIFARIAKDEPDARGDALPKFGSLTTPWSARRAGVSSGDCKSVDEFYTAWMRFETAKEFDTHEEFTSEGNNRNAKR